MSPWKERERTRVETHQLHHRQTMVQSVLILLNRKKWNNFEMNISTKESKRLPAKHSTARIKLMRLFSAQRLCSTARFVLIILFIQMCCGEGMTPKSHDDRKMSRTMCYIRTETVNSIQSDHPLFSEFICCAIQTPNLPIIGHSKFMRLFFLPNSIGLKISLCSFFLPGKQNKRIEFTWNAHFIEFHRSHVFFFSFYRLPSRDKQIGSSSIKECGKKCAIIGFFVAV